ncbi:MAG: VWA domain-containing protein [Pirellulaceae bacterium]|jgi:hypothetical protein|nr:VWA domain-containing protein [Pirellulaceae bacterium]
MQISCFHCGKTFAIRPEQLGHRGHCPHCNGEVQLPKSEDDSDAKATPAQGRWMENSLSTMVSLVLHLALVMIAAFITFGGVGGDGTVAEAVLIGELPSEQLSTNQSDELDAEEVEQDASDVSDELEVDPSIEPASDTLSDQAFAVTAPSAGGDSESFDIGSLNAGGGSMAGGGWDGLIQSLRRNGLDIVVAFDSTGSMGGEIRQVKGQIGRIGSTLVKLVPKARISIATYRDDSDSYVVKGLPLTNDIEQIDAYLRSITAGGGGDHPEAVHEGLSWSVDKNEFRPKARKVILLFGDAPPHPQFLSECLSTVSDFRGQQNGIVSTVTCRSSRRIPEFIEIAQTGGGEAFLTADERQIMTQLLVLVFGSRHRAKVMEAFDLLGR